MFACHVAVRIYIQREVCMSHSFVLPSPHHLPLLEPLTRQPIGRSCSLSLTRGGTPWNPMLFLMVSTVAFVLRCVEAFLPSVALSFLFTHVGMCASCGSFVFFFSTHVGVYAVCGWVFHSIHVYLLFKNKIKIFLLQHYIKGKCPQEMCAKEFWIFFLPVVELYNSKQNLHLS